MNPIKQNQDELIANSHLLNDFLSIEVFDKLDTPLQMDLLEELNLNLLKLMDLNHRMGFMMNEIKTIMKLS